MSTKIDANTREDSARIGYLAELVEEIRSDYALYKNFFDRRGGVELDDIDMLRRDAVKRVSKKNKRKKQTVSDKISRGSKEISIKSFNEAVWLYLMGEPTSLRSIFEHKKTDTKHDADHRRIERLFAE